MENHPELYVTKNTLSEYREKYPTAEAIGVENPLEITGGIWSTGAIKTIYKKNELYEQSLLLTNDTSMILLTGCSHPGILQSTKRAVEIYPQKKLALVTGGFHLMKASSDEVEKISRELKELGVQKIAPSHCTGKKAIKIFKESWGDSFVEMDLGDEQIFHLN